MLDKNTLVLLILITSMFFVQINFLRNASHYDEATLLLTGNLMTKGYVLYTQQAENKPPLTYLIPYLLFITHRFDGLTVLFLLRIGMMTLSSTLMIPLFLICREYFDERIGLAACAMYGSNLLVLYYGSIFHMSMLVAILETWAVYFFLNFLKNKNFRSLFLSGVITCLGIFTKQTALFLLPLFFILLLIHKDAFPRTNLPKLIFVFALGIFLTSLPFIAYIYNIGELVNFVKYSFWYNMTSRHSGVEYEYGDVMSKLLYISKIVYESEILLLVLGIPGILYAIVNRNRGKTIILSWFAVFFVSQIFVLDHIWAHYLLEFFIPGSILAAVFLFEYRILEKIGWTALVLQKGVLKFETSIKAFMGVIIGSVLVYSILWQILLIDYSFPAKSEVKIGSEIDTIEKELYVGEYLKATTTKDDSILVLGTESLYLWGDRCWPHCIEKTTDFAPDTRVYLMMYASNEEVRDFADECKESRLKYIVFTSIDQYLTIWNGTRTKPMRDLISEDFELDPLSFKFSNLLLFKRKQS